MNEDYARWNKQASPGLLLTGPRLSLTGHSTLCKGRDRNWILRGTLGLIIFTAGLAMFGESIKARMHYELSIESIRNRD